MFIYFGIFYKYMKNIEERLVELLHGGYCTPNITKLARKLNEPSSTIHYNIKKLEREGKLKTCVGVFDHKKLGMDVCAMMLVSISAEEFGRNPEAILKELEISPFVQSIEFATGDWEIIIKVRARSTDEFYQFARHVLSIKGVRHTKTLMVLKEVKTEYVKM